MEACADDYEEFSMIVSEIAKWTSGAKDAPSVGQIEQALFQSLTDNDIEAYEVQENRLQRTTAQPDHSSVAEFWFYITEQGKKWLKETDTEEMKLVPSAAKAEDQNRS
jgi:hypothetical protein